MGMFFHSAEAPPERPADPAVRPANLSRIGRLFAAYKLRLGGVLLLIVVSAGLGVVPAFLLKRVLEAIGHNDTTSLSINARGMIAIAIATGALARQRTAPGREDDAADARRYLQPRPGVALRLGHLAREDHGARRRARRPFRGRLSAPRRPRGAPAHGRPLGDGLDPDQLRDHARGGLLVRRARARPRIDRSLDPDARRVHDAPDTAVLPDRLATRSQPRCADVACPLRPDLRIPRPA